ncbi:hypothetical protein FPV67DRAFT_1530215 [Lyophyllum atratum]|nr:hypothetical protein FPV67DRAFT_1530215 [Lyophyllum atratum]
MPTAPDLIAGKEDKAKTSRRTSENFCASDTDVTLVSCDNVLFHVHRKNLEVVAGGFPPSGFDTYGEEVPLTEDAATLELLFQFAYPRRHPDLKDVSIKTLERLAEAVEKYEFFSAMNICKMRMHHVLPKHPVEVANYASKHGYVDILVDVPPFLLDIPLDEVAKSLHPAFLAPWVYDFCYFDGSD